MTSPVIKWVGGKARLLPEITKRMPEHYGRYFEPFAGGAALFFDQAPQRAVLADQNADLMTLYRELRDNVDAVIRRLRVHKRLHAERPRGRRAYYYGVRDRWNDRAIEWKPADRAAAFIYLNKTCFTPGSIVLTEDERFVNIEDVCVGDRLWGGRTVSEILRRPYDGPVLRIRGQGIPHALSVTADHPVMRTRRVARGAMSMPEFVAADQLKVNDFLLTPTHGCIEKPVDWASFWPNKRDLARSTKNRHLNLAGDPDADLSRFLGYYLADGHCTSNDVQLTMPTPEAVSSTNKSECTDDIIGICERRFGVTPSVTKMHGNKVAIAIHSLFVREFVVALISGQTHSTDPARRHTKRLNDALMVAPTAVQRSLLKSWLRADGGLRVKAGGVELSGQTVIDGLARQLHRVAQRCGLKPAWRHYRPNGIESSLVSFASSDAEALGFEVPAGRREGSGGRRPVVDGMVATRITEITALEYDGVVYNVEVDDDHRLCVDGFISHNCFNGLWRVNRAGEFNVPIGDYDDPAICVTGRLRFASKLLAHADIRTGDYASAVRDAKCGDFCYFDPPYDPVSATASFTKYCVDGFTRVDQTELATLARSLADMGVHVMASNNNTPFIRKLYRDLGFKLARVSCGRAINSDPSKRGAITELLMSAGPS